MNFMVSPGWETSNFQLVAKPGVNTIPHSKIIKCLFMFKAWHVNNSTNGGHICMFAGQSRNFVIHASVISIQHMYTHRHTVGANIHMYMTKIWDKILRS